MDLLPHGSGDIMVFEPWIRSFFSSVKFKKEKERQILKHGPKYKTTLLMRRKILYKYLALLWEMWPLRFILDPPVDLRRISHGAHLHQVRLALNLVAAVLKLLSFPKAFIRVVTQVMDSPSFVFVFFFSFTHSCALCSVLQKQKVFIYCLYIALIWLTSTCQWY